MKRIILFASGTSTDGGSGFQELAENSLTGVLQARIAAVVSQHPDGGVRKRADALRIPFVLFPKNNTAKDYVRCISECHADFAVLSGWTLLAKGLNPQTTINIHPAPLPEFGGKGMYGHFVHEAVLAAYRKGKIAASAVSMHFVTEQYDDGPIFFRYPVLIRPDDTAETLQARVNKIEHGWQSFITNLVMRKHIFWDGKNPQSLTVPPWYTFHKKQLASFNGN